MWTKLGLPTKREIRKPKEAGGGGGVVVQLAHLVPRWGENLLARPEANTVFFLLD